MTPAPSFRSTRFTRRYTLVIEVALAIPVCAVLFVLAGVQEMQRVYRDYRPGLVREWRR
jgi:hypothetical protein